MRYDDRIVCFIDILGFASLIDGTHDNGVDREDEIDRIARVLNHIRVALDIDDDQVSASKVVTQFSDSIVISFAYTGRRRLLETLSWHLPSSAWCSPWDQVAQHSLKQDNIDYIIARHH